MDVLAPGYYPQPLRAGSTFSFSLLSFVTQLLSQQPPAPVGAADGPRRLKPLPFLGIGLVLIPSLQQVGRIPKGYVRVLVFDKDSVLLSEQTITKQLTDAAGSGYEELRTHLVVQQAGYVQVYVGNESEVDVLFDDVEVSYRPGLLVQENHYDPWGLNLAGLEKTGGVPQNQYQYNGKEKQTELGLGWTDYGARIYDAQLGRMSVIDRFTEKYIDLTPFHYAANNPIRYVDINGDSVSLSHNFQNDWVLNHAFESFASTKQGQRFLSKYAAKGQNIAGRTYLQNGKYHNKGINLKYNSAPMETTMGGATDTNTDSETGKTKGNLDIIITINSSDIRESNIETIDISSNSSVNSSRLAMQIRKMIFSRAETIFHESFIHADQFTKDYIDDNRINYSQIDQNIKKSIPDYQ